MHVPFSGEERPNLDLIPYGVGLEPNKTTNFSCTCMCQAIPLSVTLLLAMSINESSATDKMLIVLKSYQINKHKLRKH